MVGGTIAFTACSPTNEPQEEPHYNVELFFNNQDVIHIELDTIQEYAKNQLVDTIYMIPDDEKGVGGAFTGFGPNALHNARMFLEERVNVSRKVRGKGDLVFTIGCVNPADSLWFVEQGWTVNEYWKTNDNPEEPGDVTIDKSNGVLPELFTINESGKQIQFSMGNLQYTQSTDTWAFAVNQYDIIGGDNVVDGTLADKIDLFGWSGSTGFAWGISTSTDDIGYSGDFVDWGQNAISNGGNKANQWRTLTNGEWYYLLDTRANASSLQGVARINLNADGSEYANGLILLPDNWTAPAGISFKSGFSSERSVQAYADYQIFTLDQWSKLEKSGAVFLPVSGYRYGTDVGDVGGDGYYWSATPFGESNAWYLGFSSRGASMGSRSRRYDGIAVRLVQDVK